jgi:hypothetical protein
MSTSVPSAYQGGVTSAIEQREVNSEYGQLWINGFYQQDLVSFSGTVAMGRSEIPVAGQDTIVYRTGRKSRDGTLSYRKADSRWEDLILTFMGLTPDDRRALRAMGIDALPTVQILVVLDDPDAWGAEVLQLNGVQFWSMPVGYTGSDIIQRDLPCTWTSEQLLLAIDRPGNDQGTANAVRPAIPTTAPGYDSGTGYTAFGGDPVF